MPFSSSRSDRRFPLTWLMLLLAGVGLPNCKSDTSKERSGPGTELGMGGAGFTSCDSHADCDDGLFCNGEERCLEVDGTQRCTFPQKGPCLEGQRCDESGGSCKTSCEIAYDADGDGHDAIECGGDDCDDSTVARYPGNQEICDEAGVDEDCDPNTLGGRGDSDLDLDGFVAAECCNITSDGTFCGDDCDDRQRDVGPGLNEVCNGIDDNCNGRIDEGIKRKFAPDEDGDGFGDASKGAETIKSCMPIDGMSDVLTDCDDSNSSVHPAAYDRCDADLVDDDCNGTPNDPPNGCVCAPATTRECPFPGRCEGSIQVCVDGLWAEECAVTAIEEICGNGVDDDCDGATDEGCSCQGTIQLCGATSVGDCQAGLQECLGDGTWGECAGAIGPKTEVCGGGDEDCDGAIDESCSPSACSAGRGTCSCDSGADDCTCTGAAYGSACECGFDRNMSADEYTLAYPSTGPASSFTVGDFYITPDGTASSISVNTYGVAQGSGNLFGNGAGFNVRRNLGMTGITLTPESPFTGTANYSIKDHMGAELAAGTVSGNTLRFHLDGEEFTSVSLIVTDGGIRLGRVTTYACD